MSEVRIRIIGSSITHLVDLSDNAGGYTRCNVAFAWRLGGEVTTETAVDDCDCMTCLVKEDHAINFRAYQDIGMSVINTGAIDTFDFFDLEPVK